MVHENADLMDTKFSCCFRYDAGDHVAVYPVNDQDLVSHLIELAGEDPDKVITLTNVDEDSSKKHPFPCPCTYRIALSHYVDITALPRTHVLKEIAEYTTDNKVWKFAHSLCNALPLL